MATRLIRNTAILAKIETTYGTDSAPAGATDALLVSNLSITPLNANNVSRDVVRPYLGGSEQLVGTRFVQCSFDVELVGSGSAGTAPAWGPLLTACGMSQTVTATTRVDYLPVSTAFPSVSLYWYDDGVLHRLLGARGTVVVSMEAGGRPLLKFNLSGLEGGVTAAALPSVTLTAFKTPEVVVDANSGDVVLGATHSASGAPALTAGTIYPSQGLMADLGNSVNFQPLLGGESIDITQREVVGKLTLDLTAAQEVALFSSVKAATLQSVGITHGTVTGNKVLVFLPTVQLINPQKAELNGKRLVSYDMRVIPTAGNDEIRIVTSF